jgi:hypothetical protein
MTARSTDEVEELTLRECPNPWCGCVPTQAIRYTGGTPQTYPWRVRCPDCGLRAPQLKTEAGAIAAWNTRHESEALTVMREALEKIAQSMPGIPYAATERQELAREALARIGRS